MTFKDWQDTANVQPLILPIRGREYRIPELGYLDNIKLREEMTRVADTARLAAHRAALDAGQPPVLDDAEADRIAGDPPTMSNEDFLAMMLGDQLPRMRADNVPPAAILHAASVAHTDAVHGRAAAEHLWNEGPDPEALAAAMAALRASTTTSPATAAAGSSTRKPASTSGTRSPRTKASRSTGTRSSRTRG